MSQIIKTNPIPRKPYEKYETKEEAEEARRILNMEYNRRYNAKLRLQIKILENIKKDLDMLKDDECKEIALICKKNYNDLLDSYIC
jgi:hypothetical protein